MRRAGIRKSVAAREERRRLKKTESDDDIRQSMLDAHDEDEKRLEQELMGFDSTLGVPQLHLQAYGNAAVYMLGGRIGFVDTGPLRITVCFIN